VLCLVRYRSLRRADQSSGGVLQNVVCLSVMVKPRRREDPGPLGAVVPGGGIYNFVYLPVTSVSQVHLISHCTRFPTLPVCIFRLEARETKCHIQATGKTAE
jgi:hypothetical protein